MKSLDIIETAQIINELTESNDHNGALIKAAELRDRLNGEGESKTTKIMKHVQSIHRLKGFMQSGMIEVREDSRVLIMADLKENLTGTYYDKINSAF